MGVTVHHGNKDGDVRKDDLRDAMRVAAGSLKSDDYATRRIQVPTRRLGGSSDHGSGYVHVTGAVSVEVFNRGEWPGAPMLEILVRRPDARDAVLRMGHPAHLVVRRDRHRLGRHLDMLAAAVDEATPWDSTPAASRRVSRFDALCELVAIQAHGDHGAVVAPVTPIDCPGPMETRRNEFVRRRDDLRLVVSSEFRTQCVRRVGGILVLRRRVEGDDLVHTLLPLRRYVDARRRDPLEVLRAMEAMPLPDGTGPLVEWRMPDRWGTII